MKNFIAFLSLLGQYLLPHHTLSRLVGWLAECRWHWLKNRLIKRFIRYYQVNMEEAAESNPEAYGNFNAFFTRALKNGARSFIDEPGSLACPVDGAISQLGVIDHTELFQAKGRYYSVEALLGGNKTLAAQFENGSFATLYLSPKDYHRVHMPLTGKLVSSLYLPGRLFSVSPLTTRQVDKLFARNERHISIFETEYGPMAMVLVGAMIVAGIETVWAGQVTPPKRQLQYQAHMPLTLEKGAEMGRFKLGSTVILLFGKDAMKWADLKAGDPVQMGQLLGSGN